MKPECKLTEWSPFSTCLAECGQGIKIRVRKPRPVLEEEESLQKIIKLYNKLKSGQSRPRRSDYDDGDGDDEEENDDSDGSSEFDVTEISEPDHPCYGTELIDRRTCERRNKPCKTFIQGTPCTLLSLSAF